MTRCPRCGEPMNGGICDNCGFPMQRMIKTSQSAKKRESEKKLRIDKK